MCHNNAASISIRGKLTRGSKRILMTQSFYGHRIKDSKNKQTSNLKAASVGRQRLICLLVSLCLDCNFLFAGRARRPRTENLGFTSWIYCREKMRLWIQLQLYTTIKHVLGFVACRRRHHVCGALRLRVADGVRPDVQKRRQAADCQQHVRVKKPSASSAASRSNVAASQSQWTDFQSGTRPRPSTNATVNERSRSWWLQLRVGSSPSVGCSKSGMTLKRCVRFLSRRFAYRCRVARENAASWLLWSLDWNRPGFNRNEFLQNKSNWGLSCSKSHTSAYCECWLHSVSKQKKNCIHFKL